MIVNELYNGSGLGNQLWCYAVTRSIAADLGYDFGIMSPHKFKGGNLFPTLSFGLPVVGGSGPEGGPPTSLPNGIKRYYQERRKTETRYRCDITDYDPELVRVPDNTKINGNMQSEDYILHRKDEIKEWFKVDARYDIREYSNDDTCVINIRGGEYRGSNELFLPKTYFTNAMRHMNAITGKNLNYVIVTDDVGISRHFFPDLPVYHGTLEWDYGVIHNAKYAIISNSSFAWFPVWTSSQNEVTIAPKYWARHNISDGFWACGYAPTRNWLWLDRDDKLFTYEQCMLEKQEFDARHTHWRWGL